MSIKLDSKPEQPGLSILIRLEVVCIQTHSNNQTVNTTKKVCNAVAYDLVETHCVPSLCY